MTSYFNIRSREEYAKYLQLDTPPTALYVIIKLSETTARRIFHDRLQTLICANLKLSAIQVTETDANSSKRLLWTAF